MDCGPLSSHDREIQVLRTRAGKPRLRTRGPAIVPTDDEGTTPLRVTSLTHRAGRGLRRRNRGIGRVHPTSDARSSHPQGGSLTFQFVAMPMGLVENHKPCRRLAGIYLSTLGHESGCVRPEKPRRRVCMRPSPRRSCGCSGSRHREESKIWLPRAHRLAGATVRARSLPKLASLRLAGRRSGSASLLSYIYGVCICVGRGFCWVIGQYRRLHFLRLRRSKNACRNASRSSRSRSQKTATKCRKSAGP
ncbi:hypothetical protein BKA62DRAFT_303654 [Auriculariales sp. MPI-PUGE-AT-0066]|nr:hypothetical protein BKA62DRAFT_303654 [Auriculariales sp. MPI-PUGE-AT-0066]